MTESISPAARRRRVSKPREQRRDDLLRAAREQFSLRGTAATTVADITDAADVGKGTFYLYFQSKEHVLAALWEEFVDGFVQHAREILEHRGNADWLRTAELLASELIDYALRHADVHRLVVASANADALAMFRAANQRIIALLHDGIVRGVADGAFDLAHPRTTAELLYFGAEGVLNDMILGSDLGRRDEVVDALTEMVRRVLPPA